MEYREAQMSVEWLESKIQKEIAMYGSISSKMISIFAEQAKVIHKQESIDLLNHHNTFDTSEEHYNKTFGGNNEEL